MGKIKKRNSIEYYLQIADSYYKLGKTRKASRYYKEAAAIDPSNLQALGNLAVTLNALGKKEEAKPILEKVIRLDPNKFGSIYNLAVLNMELMNYAEAAKLFYRVNKLNPAFTWAYNNLGTCLKNLGRLTEAETAYKKGISIDPTDVSLYSNLGNLLRQEGKMDEAIKSYQTATWLDPNVSEVFGNLGSIFTVLGYFDLAKENLMEATKINPNVPEFFYNMAIYEKDNGNLTEAAKNFSKVAELKPNFENLWNMVYLTRRQMCDWSHLKESEEHLGNDELPDQFISVITSENLSANLASARISSRKIENTVGEKRYKDHSVPANRKKIKIGYLSGDYRTHPIGEMVSGMFEYHNRHKFEVFAYSYGPDDGSWVRKMTQVGVDKFTDIKSANVFEAADTIRSDGVDILIDITGNTKGNKLEICALRPAPVQVTWLGFPGTSGASFFDFLIADKVIVPEKDRPFYSEKVLYLPHTYQVNNDKILPTQNGYTRKHFGLPERGIIFSSFNQAYKIEPVVWKMWMNILKKVPGSVLWLWDQYEEATKNLSKEAKRYRIDPKRIVFGKKLDKSEHIERLSLADIGLDTLIYGGHTTTSDSLLAGVPVISLMGNHFASRVCASLLFEAGIPEMVVKDLREYEDLAIRLAGDTVGLKQIKAKITREKLLTNLYNTKRFVKNLEEIYERIYV